MCSPAFDSSPLLAQSWLTGLSDHQARRAISRPPGLELQR
jgi:hypothetical protein